jgi:hypothetical protein
MNKKELTNSTLKIIDFIQARQTPIKVKPTSAYFKIAEDSARIEKIIKSVTKTPPKVSPVKHQSIIIPPNWTNRKQVLRDRQQMLCGHNIDYHLDQLSSCYKSSGKKILD